MDAVKMHLRMADLLIVSIFSTVFALSSSSQIPGFRELCPRVPVCSNGSSQSGARGNLSVTCCLPCSCSDTCRLTGACCPDIQDNLTMDPRFRCRTQKQIYKTYLNRDDHGFNSDSGYRVIDECPERSEGEGYDESIIQRCKEAKELTDVIFVSGRFSRLTYLNEQCARCNGENDTVKWNLYITYGPNGLIFSTIDEMDKTFITHGIFTVVPPSVDVALSSLCSINSINTCNETGLWDIYNEELKKKCISYQSLFSIVYMNKRQLFLNVYCFLCNVPTGTVVPEQCGTSDELYKGLAKTIFTSFNALITMTKNKGSTSVLGNADCSTGEVLDPFFKVCRHLICPPGTIPAYGICQPIVDKVTGYKIYIQFQLDIESEDNVEQHLDNTRLTDLDNFIKKLSRNGIINCKVCEMHLSRLINGNVALGLSIQSGEGCDYIALIKNMFLTYKSMPFVIHSQRLQTNLTLSYVNNMNDIKYVIDSPMTLATCFSNIIYTPNVVHCPSVIFEIQNISKICDDSCVQSNIDPFSSNLGNGTYIVCLHHYMRALGSLDQACNSCIDKLLFYFTVAYGLVVLIKQIGL